MIDLSTLNSHLNVPHFRMEMQQSIRSALRSGEFTASTDVQDAYLHVSMTESVQRYLSFRVGVPTLWSIDITQGTCDWWLKNLLQHLGWRVNLEKSNFIPS